MSNISHKRHWVAGYCDCLSYKNRGGELEAFPLFFPMALCGKYVPKLADR